MNKTHLFNLNKAQLKLVKMVSSTSSALRNITANKSTHYKIETFSQTICMSCINEIIHFSLRRPNDKRFKTSKVVQIPSVTTVTWGESIPYCHYSVRL